MMRQHEITVERGARYYSLGDLDRATSVWIVLHGHGQLAAEFIAACAPLAVGRTAVVAPEALNRYYKERPGDTSHAQTPVGATWMTREHRLQEIDDYVHYLDRVAAQLAPRRIVGTLGFSQGAVTGWRWVTRGTTAVTRYVSWAGELPADLDLAGAAARLTDGVDLVVGTSDESREWIKPARQAEVLEAAGVSTRAWEFDGGHRLDRSTLTLLASR